MLTKLSNTFRNSTAAQTVMAGLLTASLTAANASRASAQELASTDTSKTVAPKGKTVILRIGRGFNPIAADGVADLLIEEGCPTEVTNEGGRYKRLTVEIDGEGFKFKQPGSAAAAALKWCLEKF